MDYSESLHSQLRGALGEVSIHYEHQLHSLVSSFQSTYHPNYLSHTYSTSRDALPFPSGDTSDADLYRRLARASVFV